MKHADLIEELAKEQDRLAESEMSSLHCGSENWEFKAAGKEAEKRRAYAAALRALTADAGARPQDGNRPLPIDRETLGRMVREAWVRWAGTQPAPKPSWLVPYDELAEPDKEADRQIGEAIARWTLIHDAARNSLTADADAGAQTTTVTGVVDVGQADHSRRVYEDGKQVWPDAGAQGEAVKQADAYLAALLGYSEAFFKAHKTKGPMSAVDIVETMKHIESAARGLHALASPVPPSDPVREAARVLLADPLKARLPGVSAMFSGASPPAINSFADLDAAVHRWLKSLAGMGDLTPAPVTGSVEGE